VAGTCLESKKTKKNIVALLSAVVVCTVFLLRLDRILSGVLLISVIVFNVVYSCYNIKSLVKELNEKNKKTQSDLAVKENEMSVMLSQIKPHFIYNTLNTIQYLCRTEPELAAETIADFSQYLRMNLSITDGKQTVPFSMELEHVKSYLKIEKLRFKHRLKVKYEIEAEDFTVPVLSIQPLVENAVKHGMTNRMNGITIKISARREEDRYVVRIKDDGIGFDKNELAQKHESLGLNNVKMRIETLLDGSLTIESMEGMGTTVEVMIPVK